MTKDLYFIPLIVQALKQANPKEALRAAVEIIESLSREPEYERGYRQFQRFMEESRNASMALEDLLAQLIETQGETPTRERALEWSELRSIIETKPELAENLQALEADLSTSEAEFRELSLIINLNGRPWRSMKLSRPFSTLTIKGLVAGHYAVLLDTGRELWEDRLTEKDLIWGEAFPDQPLALAADTGDVEQPATRKARILEGEWTLLVLPGLESGRMKLAPQAGS